MKNIYECSAAVVIGALMVKYWDRQFWANSADPDHIAPKRAVWLGLHCFLFCS